MNDANRRTQGFEELEAIFRHIRKRAEHGDGYCAEGLAKGPEFLGKKVGEEAVEVLIAALKRSDERLVDESADLLFHLLLLLVGRKVEPARVIDRLRSRAGRAVDGRSENPAARARSKK